MKEGKKIEFMDVYKTTHGEKGKGRVEESRDEMNKAGIIYLKFDCGDLISYYVYDGHETTNLSLLEGENIKMDEFLEAYKEYNREVMSIQSMIAAGLIEFDKEGYVIENGK